MWKRSINCFEKKNKDYFARKSVVPILVSWNILSVMSEIIVLYLFSPSAKSSEFLIELEACSTESIEVQSAKSLYGCA